MSAVPSLEQEEMKATARQFLERELPLDGAVARAGQEPVPLASPDEAFTTTSWQSLAAELGAQALDVPEVYGGLDGSFFDVAMVLEEAGRALAPWPLHLVAAATAALSRQGDESIVRPLLEGIAEGAVVLAPVALLTADEVGLTAELTAASPVVSGFVKHVVGGDWATHLLTWVDDLGLVVVDLSLGATRSVRPAADPTRTLVAFDLTRAPVTVVDPAGQTDGRQRVLAVMRTAVALDSVGGARRCLEIAVDHAKTREQFGQPIGSFQAIKHKCAEMLLAVEAATSSAYAAATAADGSDDAEFDSAARLAYHYANEAYALAASETIQILGGIGFTWEHPAHLFFKRAKVNGLLAGTAVEVRAQTADVLGI